MMAELTAENPVDSSTEVPVVPDVASQTSSIMASNQESTDERKDVTLEGLLDRIKELAASKSAEPEEPVEPLTDGFIPPEPTSLAEAQLTISEVEALMLK